jgi:ATP phosphoribosyltransferase regulatory subunit
LTIEKPVATMLAKLAELSGDDALERADKVLADAATPVQEALDYLRKMAELISVWLPQLPVHFDLAELRGYHFHTGVVFAAFVPGNGKEIARGGRYDEIGRVFGRARPATGFSADLKTLIRIGDPETQPAAKDALIFAAWSDDPSQQASIDRLRAEGRHVVCALPGQQGGAVEMGCGEQLVQSNGEWQLISV